MQDMGDDIYPNDGNGFRLLQEPAEQKTDIQEEKAEVYESLPLLEKIIEHFDEQIRVLGDIDGIPRQTMLDKEQVLVVLNANDVARRFLLGEKGWLEDLVSDYTKK